MEDSLADYKANIGKESPHIDVHACPFFLWHLKIRLEEKLQLLRSRSLGFSWRCSTFEDSRCG